MRRAISSVLIVLMIISYGAVSAKPLLDGSVEFLAKTENLANTTKDISLALMALVAAQGKVDYDLSENITRLADLLISRQNPDGGWGYFAGSTSDVVDTSYAVIALNKALALYKKGTPKYSKIFHSLDNGVGFILSSYSGRGWGYVKDTTPEFYPTVMAIWALGERGFGVNHPYIRRALNYLDDVESYGVDKYEALALKLLAFKSVGQKADTKLIMQIKESLDLENLTVSDRALLTYVLVEYEDINFDVAKALLTLESLKHGETAFYWADEPGLFTQSHIFEASSYATLSFALVSDKLSEGLENPFKTSCEALKNAQNPDGGWSYFYGFPSNEKATYYALKALKLCYFRDPSIEKGLEWVRAKYEEDKLVVKESHEMYSPYVYTLLTLLEFNMLNETEKAENIELIKSVKIDTGKWGNFLGPQPYDTALAIKSLLALGVSSDDADIQKAKDWLLSISKSGWGTYVNTGFYSYMLPPEVSVTLEVLEALAPVSTKEDLDPHLKWLIEQRTEDGGWANIKEHYLIGVFQYKEKPTVELTIRATELLAEFGYDYKQDILNWLMDKEHDGLWGDTIVDSALATVFLSQFKFIPKINLYDVIRLIPEQKFYVVYTNDRNLTAQQVKASIDKLFETNVTVEKFQGFEDANYVVLADFGDFNIKDYNPYVKLEVSNETIYINGNEYSIRNTVVLIPGKTETGYILFVFYKKDLDNVVIKLFESGLVKYLKGDALVVTYEDKNRNGVVDLDDLTVKFLR
ncbi:MAG: prenyltransferase [Thermococcus sp.]|uniref:prenyltransferase/squalene oxidase repeat-containing protein n=1 Tax=Thermococcus sp. TaxID=35749 RepID=UPI001DFDADB8|nr:prenyltransferase/squalene oxidase repeat-containing protein [Thermococcus sp.]MBO8175124.1 prenyltransferase [Thermococcus sp.]